MTEIHEKIEEIGFKPISRSAEEAKERIRQYQMGEITPLKTFSQKMNEKLMFVPGDKLVIAGRPGVGKSAFANRLIQSIHDNNSKVLTLYFTLEMAAWRQVMRLMSSRTQQSVTDLLKNEYNADAFHRLSSIATELSEYDIYFRETPPTYARLEDMISRVTQALPEDYRVCVVFDHTRLVKTSNTKASEEQKIRELMETVTTISNTYETFNIFLSQMNRKIDDDGGDRAPTESDIFGADAVVQFSDTILALHRPEMYHIEQMDMGGINWDTRSLLGAFVLKNRDGWSGMIPYNHNLAHNQVWDREVVAGNGSLSV